MLMTEQDAKGKWCPFARVARQEMIKPSQTFDFGQETIIAGVNRDALGKASSPIASCRCIANDCMAWRWYEFDTAEDGKRTAGTRGMCGLAGRQY